MSPTGTSLLSWKGMEPWVWPALVSQRSRHKAGILSARLLRLSPSKDKNMGSWVGYWSLGTRAMGLWNNYLPLLPFLFFSFFLGPHSAHATATAMPDPSCICNLQHTSLQHRILNPLSKARDRTHNIMVPSWICFLCATMRTPHCIFYN